MRIDELWVVVDPEEESELGDICFKAESPAYLIRWAVGSAIVGRPRNVAFYTTEDEAVSDAMWRFGGLPGTSHVLVPFPDSDGGSGRTACGLAVPGARVSSRANCDACRKALL